MSESKPDRDELEDRLLDQSLDELLGGKRPPDLSQRILGAVESAKPVRAVKWRNLLKYALAASLLIAVCVALLLPARQQARQSARTVAASDSIADESLEAVQAEPFTVPVESSAPGVRIQMGRFTGDAAGGTTTDPNSISGNPRPEVFREQQMGGMGTGFGMGMGGGIGGRMQRDGMPSGGMMPTGMAGAGMPGAGIAEREVGNTQGENRGGGMPDVSDPRAFKELTATRRSQDSKPNEPLPTAASKPATDFSLEQKKQKIEETVSGLSSIKSTANHPADQAAATVNPSGPAPFQTFGRPLQEGGGQQGGQVFNPFAGGNPQGQGPGQAGDRHSRITENPFLAVSDNPLSTFSIDVDTASYSKTRRYLLENNTLPPPDAVRIEELVNYFSYDYSPPTDNAPFAAHIEVAACPWRPEHRLVRVGLKGKEIARDERPASNLVFLLDVSGSMQPKDRLPRVRRSMRMLVEQLGENDRVAIVVYASASGMVLPSTRGYDKAKILAALDSLEAGGSTNGGAGIRLAYDTALQNFIRGGTNRVILCTDGDFNVGVTSTAELERLAEEKAQSGVALTVLGYGMGNHNDDMLERLADKGNGNYGYIDTEQEARKLLVEQLGGTLVTIAKDVKIQIEFNPQQVGAYRLIGYENRLLRAEDFNDDKKDAGEIGAGHTVTALYELAPPANDVKTPAVDPLRYQRPAGQTEAATSKELLTLKLRYKEPDGQESKAPLIFPVSDSGRSFGQATDDFQFAAAVAGFGMLLRDSAFKGNLTYGAVLELAQESIGADRHGYRAGLIELVQKAKLLSGRP